MQVFSAANTAPELEKAKPVLAFLPVGATEQHSAHLPLHTDTFVGDLLSAKILEKLDTPGNAYLLPSLPFSSSEENTGYTGTVHLTIDTIKGMVNDIFDTIDRQGMDKLVLSVWHGGNFIFKCLAREINYREKCSRLIYFNPWEHLPTEKLTGLPRGFDHAGQSETAIMLHLAAELVRKKEATDNAMDFSPAWLDLHSLKNLSKGLGHVGTPTKATAEQGRELTEALVDNAAAALSKLLEISNLTKEY